MVPLRAANYAGASEDCRQEGVVTDIIMIAITKSVFAVIASQKPGLLNIFRAYAFPFRHTKYLIIRVVERLPTAKA